jgi:exonuclease III
LSKKARHTLWHGHRFNHTLTRTAARTPPVERRIAVGIVSTYDKRLKKAKITLAHWKRLGFIDLAREAIPEPEKLFSWWSYRAADFRASNGGLRLDHIWVTPGLRPAAFHTGAPLARVHDDVRAWDRPSDHAPITADLVL